jgi:iron complex transport system ATP-binding protein
MIEVCDVSVARNGRTVVDSVSMTVAPGELVALIGPNGSGKSSLVAAICGDLPYDGHITVCSTRVETGSRAALARSRAVVTQDNPVSLGFTVAEVVGFGRAPWRGTVHEARDEEFIAEALTAMDLHNLCQRPVQQLSGGERARVAMARALAQATDVLILDEPTAALDPRHQMDVLATVRELVDAGRTAVVVLHDLTLAASFADCVVLLREGRIVAQGSADTVMVPGTLEAAYDVRMLTLTDPTTGRPVVVPVSR